MFSDNNKPIQVVKNKGGNTNSAYIDEDNLKFTFRNEKQSASILLHHLRVRKLLIEKEKIEKELNDFIACYINSDDLGVVFELHKLTEYDHKTIKQNYFLLKFAKILFYFLSFLLPLIGLFILIISFSVFPYLKDHQTLSLFILITIVGILEGIFIWIGRIIKNKEKIISNFYNESKKYQSLFEPVIQENN
jgi:hypothetical protein